MTTVEAQNNVETQNRWWDPRNLPLSLKLMLPIVFIVTFGAAVNLHFADSSARETLTDQIGEAFASQAQSLSTQSRESLTASVSSLQTMALAGDIGEQLSQKNSSYVGSTSEILAEINALDEMWVQGQGSEALVRGVTTTDRVINPVDNVADVVQIGGNLPEFDFPGGHSQRVHDVPGDSAHNPDMAMTVFGVSHRTQKLIRAINQRFNFVVGFNIFESDDSRILNRIGIHG